MNLGEFHTEVEVALGRGDSLSSRLPFWIEEAVQWLENNYTFQYMKRWKEFQIDASIEFPYIISIYQVRPKKFQSLRYVSTEDSGRFQDLKRIEPEDRTTRKPGMPSAFWLDGVENIVLDSIPQEDFTIEGHIHCFTVWQPTALTARHFLIDRYRTVLLSRSCMIAASRLRDARLYETWKAQTLDNLTTINVAETDLQYMGSEGDQMQWTPNFPDDEFLRMGDTP